MLQTFLFFVTVAMLLFYQSPVNSRGRKVENNITHNVSYQWNLALYVMLLSIDW
jgi:hypothetical protein